LFKDFAGKFGGIYVSASVKIGASQVVGESLVLK